MNRHKLLRYLIWLYCLSWAFDFRGTETGGGAAQYLLFALTAASAAAVILLGFRRLTVRPVAWLVLLWGGYLIFSLVIMKVQSVAFGLYIRNMLPCLLLFFSLCVTLIAAAEGFSYKTVLYPMLIAGTINIVWRAAYIIVIIGTPITEVRVEILSQCLPFVLAWVFCVLVYRPAISKIAVGIGMLGIGMYVLSITRSAILILGAEILVLLATVPLIRSFRVLPPGFRRAKGRQLLLIGVALVVVAVVTISTTFVLERWVERMLRPVGSDYMKDDPSKLTRLAETKSFMTILNNNPEGWVFGMGVGHEYYWDESFHPELAYTYGNLDIFRQDVRSVTFPGHSIWTYALFSGGIVGLGLHILTFFGGLWIAWRSLFQLRWAREFPPAEAVMPLIAQVGFLSLSLTFNPFIERGSTICIGMVMAFPQFLILEAWRKKHLATTTPQP